MNQQHVVKKHVGAIHVTNNISFLQRKISNVLLLNAYPELQKKEEHTIAVSALADVIGFDSKNTEYLKDALEGLATTAIKWNLTDETGVEEWGVLSILAEARVRGGICTYVYPPTLRNMLADPQIYALLDVRIQRRFQSAYALALFENCLRYAGVGRTPVWELDLFKKLMGVPETDNYKDFKQLNFYVIKKAVTEVNAVSTIEVEMIPHKAGRRVVAVQFSVREKLQEGLQLEAPLFNEALLRQLVDEFELTEPQAKSILALHSEEYITGNLDVVAERFRIGRVKEIGPYTLTALREDFRIKPSALKERFKKEKTAKANQIQEQLVQQSKVDLKTDAARAWLASLADTSRDALIQEYQTGKLPPLIRKRLAEKGMGHPMVQADFLNFVARSMPAGK